VRRSYRRSPPLQILKFVSLCKKLNYLVNIWKGRQLASPVIFLIY
jgi:hypothetical protein